MCELYSPDLGDKPKVVLLPIEIKTGKYQSYEHQVQPMIYSLLLMHKYSYSFNLSSLLLYTKSQTKKVVSFPTVQIFQTIYLRNQAAKNISLLRQSKGAFVLPPITKQAGDCERFCSYKEICALCLLTENPSSIRDIEELQAQYPQLAGNKVLEPLCQAYLNFREGLAYFQKWLTLAQMEENFEFFRTNCAPSSQGQETREQLDASMLMDNMTQFYQALQARSSDNENFNLRFIKTFEEKATAAAFQEFYKEGELLVFSQRELKCQLKGNLIKSLISHMVNKSNGRKLYSVKLTVRAQLGGLSIDLAKFGEYLEIYNQHMLFRMEKSSYNQYPQMRNNLFNLVSLGVQLSASQTPASKLSQQLSLSQKSDLSPRQTVYVENVISISSMLVGDDANKQ